MENADMIKKEVNMKKMWIFGVLTLLMTLALSADFLPRLEACGGGCCGGGEPPQTPSWGELKNDSQSTTVGYGQNDPQKRLNDYQNFLTKAQIDKKLVLTAFCADKESEDFLRTVKINVIPQIPESLTKEEQQKAKEDAAKAREEAKRTGKKVEIPRQQPETNPPVVRVGEQERFVTDFVYILVCLSSEDIKSLSLAEKNKSKGSPSAMSLSANCQLALDYKVKDFTQLVFCDWYGNELGRKELTTIKQMGPITEKARTDMLEEQMRLEESLQKKLKEAEKSFEEEKVKQKFTSATVARLKKIADYKGEGTESYEPVVKSRDYLNEINNLAVTK
jgi:hypothetical protein